MCVLPSLEERTHDVLTICLDDVKRQLMNRNFAMVVWDE